MFEADDDDFSDEGGEDAQAGSREDVGNNARARIPRKSDRGREEHREGEGEVFQPSKVLHVMNLPHDVTTEELMSLFLPIPAERVYMVGRFSALIQLASVEEAQKVLSQLTVKAIRGRALRIQFSSSSEIRQQSEITSSEQRVVIMIGIKNPPVPVHLEDMLKVCSRFGTILRIITFTKGTDFHALVEYENHEQAQRAKTFLDGKNLFDDCCPLLVSFSNKSRLKVKPTDTKSRDFTTGGRDLERHLPVGGPPAIPGARWPAVPTAADNGFDRRGLRPAPPGPREFEYPRRRSRSPSPRDDDVRHWDDRDKRPRREPPLAQLDADFRRAQLALEDAEIAVTKARERLMTIAAIRVAAQEREVRRAAY